MLNVKVNGMALVIGCRLVGVYDPWPRNYGFSIHSYQLTIPGNILRNFTYTERYRIVVSFRRLLGVVKT